MSTDGTAARAGGRAAPLAVAALVAGLLAVAAIGAGWARRQSPLARGWRAAQAAGHYTFSGVTRWEAGADRAEHRLTGEGWPDGRLALTVTTAASAPLRLALSWPGVTALSDGGATTAVDPHSLARLLPGGDPMLLLAAGQGATGRGLEPLPGGDCRAWSFRVGGRAYQARWHDHPGFLPVNADSGGMPTFQAAATLWQDPRTRLPCRLAAELELPRVAGEQPGRAWLDWTYRWPDAGPPESP